MAKTLKQRVADKCEQFGCILYDHGSHLMVAFPDGHRRVWNCNNSHSITEYIDDKPNEALRELLYRMSYGANDNSGKCDDGESCETCGN